MTVTASSSHRAPSAADGERRDHQARAVRLLVCLSILLIAPIARAAPGTVGLFAPSAPFPSTAARVELANRLGSALGDALHAPITGRVYARAADFAAAVKRGDVAIAVVDPAYLATAGGSYTIVATALHGADAERGWQLIARTGARLADLQGKRVLVPSIGGREVDLVSAVLLGGELARTYFQLEAAPDTAAALAALALGKADAVIVPAADEPPPGTAVVLALPTLPDPVLVLYGNAPRDAILAAATAFHGDATITGFGAVDPDVVHDLARRFTVPAKRAPFAVPALHALDLDALLAGRTFVIARTPAAAFAITPAPR